MNEQAIQRAVFQHLAQRPNGNIFAFHCPNGGKRSPIEAAIFKGIGVKAGVPDVLIVKDGTLYALELKAEKGKLSEKQVETIFFLSHAGAITGWAQGLDAALVKLENWGLLKPNASGLDVRPNTISSGLNRMKSVT